MNPVTRKDIETTLELVNRLLGTPDRYSLDICNGGFRVVSDSGSRDVSPRGTKRQTYDWLWAMVAGIEAAQQQQAGGTWMVQEQGPVGHWADAEWQTDGEPTRFTSKQAAEDEIDELIDDVQGLVDSKYMSEPYLREDYRAVEV